MIYYIVLVTSNLLVMKTSKIQFEQKRLRKLYPAGPRLWHFVIGADVAVGGVFIALLLTPNQKYV